MCATITVNGLVSSWRHMGGKLDIEHAVSSHLMSSFVTFVLLSLSFFGPITSRKLPPVILGGRCPVEAYTLYGASGEACT